MTAKNELWATPAEIDLLLGDGSAPVSPAARIMSSDPVVGNVTAMRPYLELFIQASAVSTQPYTNQAIEAYLLATDHYDQGYDGGDTLTDPLIAPVAVMALYARVGAQFAAFNLIPVPPRKFKILLINRANVSMYLLARGYLCNRTLG